LYLSIIGLEDVIVMDGQATHVWGLVSIKNLNLNSMGENFSNLLALV